MGPQLTPPPPGTASSGKWIDPNLHPLRTKPPEPTYLPPPIQDSPTPLSTPDWTPWQRLQPQVWFTPVSLAETLLGGQAFRWVSTRKGVYNGIWEDHFAQVALDQEGFLLWRCPPAAETATRIALIHYFAAEADFRRLADSLPWRSDPVLQDAVFTWPGLRILRQPLGETLLAFLCSSSKRIVQIREVLENLARDLGRELFPHIRALPTWERLASLPESALRQCKLGYRARYIHATARFLASHPGWLDEVSRLPYNSARAALVQLPGVGHKIADCTLLFGAYHLDAFPIDTWINKVLVDLYQLDNWSNAQLEHFARIHFGPLAGLAQQYLFAYIRQRP